MLTISKPLAYLDLAYVLLNLWPRGQAELDGMGWTREQAFVRFAGWVGAGPSGCMKVDGVPACFIGVVKDEPSFTWFQATDAFEQHASAITKWLRRECKAWDGPLVIYSQCIHEDAGKWFRVLGFDRDAWQGTTEAGKPLYRFRRR